MMPLRFRLAGASLIILLLAGCVSDKPRGSKKKPDDPQTRAMNAPISNTDPCAMQMHDICGSFLLFYSAQTRLPSQLGELYSTGVLGTEIRFICPVSQQPYIYNPGGIMLAEQNARVVLYDATAAHSGFRWAVSIHEPQPGQPMIAKVIALPDQFFLLQK